ncbi:MAG: integrin alpha [Planctomycetota bacterium]|jgi:hypothetical protein|nr:integrin alpha [Planctomycetota bacterium]
MKTLSLIFAGIVVLASPTLAQEELYRFDGTNAHDYLGTSVASNVDVNNDGYMDIIAGAPNADINGNDSGEVLVFSGIDGSIIYRLAGDSASDYFGQAVAGLGDLNGDGFDDFAVGAYLDDKNGTDSGSVFVYSGIDGSVITEKYGDSGGDYFGWSIAGGQDLNNDGFNDWIAGAKRDDNNGTYSGSVRAFSGKTKASLFIVSGNSSNDYFGDACAMVGDTNGDGYMDFAVAAPWDDPNGTDSGKITIHDGNGGSVLFSVFGTTQDYAGQGTGICGLGDVNGDTLADIAIGFPFDDDFGGDMGKVQVVSGLDGSTLYTVGGEYEAKFGWSLASAGDVDRDGINDFMAGRENGNSVDLCSGVDGLLLYRFTGIEYYGKSISGGGDINGDGLLDLVIGCRGYDSSKANAGSVFVSSSRDFSGKWPSLPTTFAPINQFYFDDFDIRQGILPNHYGLSYTDASTFERDPEAWCNVGNFAPCLTSQSGNFALEMGLAPDSNNYHEVFNALTIGLDGQGSGGHILSFWAYNCGDNPQDGDGVFVSEDGVNWQRVFDSWDKLPENRWTFVSDVNLSNTGVSTQGHFYLRFSQQDNFPYFYNEGVAIDDITVVPSIVMEADNFSAGGYATVTTEGCTPDHDVWLAVSFAGGGPISSPWGTAYLTPPFHTVIDKADPSGTFRWIQYVRPSWQGRTLWLQSLDLVKGVLSNPVSATIR